MTDRRERLCDLADTILRGKRYEAADNHELSMRTLPDEIKQLSSANDVYHEARYHFLCGWDEAMSLKSDELRDENSELHGMMLDLCTRLMIRRCSRCKGLGVGGDFEPCVEPGCQNGWVEVPPGEPERIVSEVKKSQRSGKCQPQER